MPNKFFRSHASHSINGRKQVEFGDFINSWFYCSASTILRQHARSVTQKGYETIRVVRDSTLLNQVLALYQDPSFSIRKPPAVIFENEDGCDAGGLTRDFFSTAVQQILDPSNGLFEGCGTNLVPTFNTQAVVDGKFCTVGRVFGHSTLHGGPSNCLSDPVVSCMMGKPLSEIDIAVSSIVTPSVREVAHAIELANEDTQLADIPGVFEVLGTAGITLPFTCSNAPRLIRQLAVHDVLLKRIAPIQAIQKGLNEVNIIDLVKKNPTVKSILLFKERPLDAEVLLSLISLPTTVSDEQKRTIDFLCQFQYTADTKVLQVSSVHYWGFIGSTYGVSTSNISL